jgi:uncharacterized membrane protein SpoIIM required for sporulation
MLREPVFLRQNRQKWQEFEQVLKSSSKADPDTIADLFVQITDDLSYAQTFYPQSKSRKYLNQLAVRVFLALYRTRRQSPRSFIRYWVHDLPLALHDLRWPLLACTLLFALFAFVGYFSSANDPSITRSVLGSDYVDQTIRNIEKGDPTAIYKDSKSFEMFVRIAFNNLLVMFKMYLAGFLFQSVPYLVYNAFMLGSFFELFARHNVYQTAWLTILIHGTLEISAIVVAAAATFKLMGSVILPGSWPLKVSFLRGVQTSLFTVIGLIPVFVIAAIFESYVTRRTDMGLGLNLVFVVGSALFVLFYFVIYPQVVARRQPKPYAEGEVIAR